MDDYTQIKTADLERLRLAITTVRDVLDSYPSKVNPITTADRDQKLADEICLWCFLPIGERKKSRGCHEYCVTKAISQADEELLMQLNRLMPASKGGRPSKRLSQQIDAAKSEATNLKAKGKKNN